MTSSLSRATAIYIAAAAISALVPFAVLPLLARWLTPAEFGVMGNFLAIVNLAVVLTGLSTQGIISVVYFRQSAADVGRYIRAIMKLLVGSLMIVAASALLFGEFVESHTGISRAWLLVAVSISAAQFVISVSLAVYQATERAVLFGVTRIAQAFLWGSASLILIGVAGMGWEGRAVAQLGGVVIVAVCAAWLLRRLGYLGAGGETVPVGELLRFGLPVVPHSLAATALVSADRLLLTSRLGTDQAGIYFAAFQISAILTVTATAVNQAWVPWLFKRLANGDARSRREIVLATYVIFGVMLIAAAIVAIGAPYILPVIVGRQYLDAVDLLYWLAPAAAMSGMYFFVTNYLFYNKRTGMLSLITVPVAVLQVVLILWLLPIFGAKGVAVAVCCSSFLFWTVTWAVAARIEPMPWLDTVGYLFRFRPR